MQCFFFLVLNPICRTQKRENIEAFTHEKNRSLLLPVYIPNSTGPFLFSRDCQQAKDLTRPLLLVSVTGKGIFGWVFLL